MGGPERNHAFLKLAFKCNGKSSEFAFPIHFLQQGLALQAGQKGTFFFFLEKRVIQSQVLAFLLRLNEGANKYSYHENFRDVDICPLTAKTVLCI